MATEFRNSGGIPTSASRPHQPQCRKAGQLRRHAPPERLSFYILSPSKRFSCLNCAVGVDDKEGVVGKVGGGVQHSKGARDLSVCLKVRSPTLLFSATTSPVLSASMTMGPPLSLLSLQTLERKQLDIKSNQPTNLCTGIESEETEISSMLFSPDKAARSAITSRQASPSAGNEVMQ